MLDYFNLSNNTDTQVFFAQNNNIFQTWQKPRGCKLVHFFVIGGGGAGAGGRTGSVGTDRTGSGGGGSGGIYTSLIPSILIPDRLYIVVGRGGIGAAPNTNGTGGGVSLIRTTLNTTDVNQGLLARPTQATGGNAGGTGGGGVSVLSGIYRNLGPNLLHNSVTGGAGVAGSSGTSINLTFLLSGGAGGGSATLGGTSFSGGSINGNGFVPTILGGINPSDNGENGFSSFNPLFFTGGAGGAANANGVGGNGGNGGIGCGGGGGGAGVTGGRGGNGGDGLVIITCW